MFCQLQKVHGQSFVKKNNMNASGLLKWNSKDGSVSGNGEDSKGKKVKFKVSGKN